MTAPPSRPDALAVTNVRKTYGGVVALAASPHTALVVVIVCVTGALGTLAAGSWQSARFALRQEAIAAAGCAGGCGVCTQSCR